MLHRFRQCLHSWIILAIVSLWVISLSATVVEAKAAEIPLTRLAMPNDIDRSRRFLARRGILLTGNSTDTCPAHGMSGATDSHSEDKSELDLTTVPGHYGYAAPFELGTFLDKVGGNSHSNSNSNTTTSGKRFNLLVDTGSDLIVLTSDTCTAQDCQKVRHRFDCSKSETCVVVTAPVGSDNSSMVPAPLEHMQNYGDGTSAFGIIVQDTVRIPGTDMSISCQELLTVEHGGLNLTTSYGQAIDGIIGLNLMSDTINSTFIQSLDNLDYPQAGIMSLWLSENLESGEGGGLLFGEIDESRFEPPLRWSPLGPSPYDWSLELKGGLCLNETALMGTEGIYAIIDSGSDGIYLVSELYDFLMNRIPGAAQDKRTKKWLVPCEGATALRIGVQEGVFYEIPYHSWVNPPSRSTSTSTTTAAAKSSMCKSKVYGTSPGPILLGAVFLRQVYAVFDSSVPGQTRIGLANIRIGRKRVA